MNLRDMVEQDLALTLEDDVNGFGIPITVIAPCGTTADLVGQSGDIHFMVDPETGQGVNSRTAHLALRISSLTAAGLGIPEAVNKKTLGKPWIFTYQSLTMTVRRSHPDKTLGIVTVILETYVP